MTVIQPRKPAGAPTAGQFATTMRAESSTALEQLATEATDSDVITARDALASALGVPADAVVVAVDTSHACGVPEGTATVRLSAPTPGEQPTQEVSLTFYRSPSGGTYELDCTAFWSRAAAPGFDSTTDSTRSPYDRERKAEPETVVSLVRSTLRQAHLQRRLDTMINDPQYERKGHTDLTRWFEILRAEVHVTADTATVSFADQRARHRDVLRLNVDAAGRVLAADLDTDYGVLRVGSDDLPRVLSRLERELCWAVDARPIEEPIAAHLETRLRGVFAAC